MKTIGRILWDSLSGTKGRICDDAQSVFSSPFGDPDAVWTEAELTELRERLNDAGLELEAIENFDPAHWHDVLLDGPKRDEQLDKVKTMIRNAGKAGIPVVGGER